MAWLVVLCVAAVLGWVTSLVMRRFGMGPRVCVPVAMLGAVLGGVIYKIYNPANSIAFYGLAALLCLLALGGSVYSFFLSGAERRI